MTCKLMRGTDACPCPGGAHGARPYGARVRLLVVDDGMANVARHRVDVRGVVGHDGVGKWRSRQCRFEQAAIVKQWRRS